MFGGAKLKKSGKRTELWGPCDSVGLPNWGVWRAAGTALGSTIQNSPIHEGYMKNIIYLLGVLSKSLKLKTNLL